MKCHASVRAGNIIIVLSCQDCISFLERVAEADGPDTVMGVRVIAISVVAVEYRGYTHLATDVDADARGRVVADAIDCMHCELVLRMCNVSETVIDVGVS